MFSPTRDVISEKEGVLQEKRLPKLSEEEFECDPTKFAALPSRKIRVQSLYRNAEQARNPIDFFSPCCVGSWRHILMPLVL